MKDLSESLNFAATNIQLNIDEANSGFRSMELSLDRFLNDVAKSAMNKTFLNQQE